MPETRKFPSKDTAMSTFRLRTPRNNIIFGLFDVTFCDQFACSIVSFRRLRKQGIYWETCTNPTTLRHLGGYILALVDKECDQFVLEKLPETFTIASFFIRRNQFNSYTKRKPLPAWPRRWHARLGHLGSNAFRHLQGAAEDVRIKGSWKDGPKTVECDACGTAKMKRQIRRAPRHTEGERQPMECLAIDLHNLTEDSEDYDSLLFITDRASGYC